jgi:hypothetical protein
LKELKKNREKLKEDIGKFNMDSMESVVDENEDFS